MPGLLPFLFALVIVDQAGRSQPHIRELSFWPLLALAGCAILVWALLGLGVAWLVGRSGRYRWLGVYDLAAQSAAIALFAGLCFGFGWASVIPGTVLDLLLFVAFMLVHWWAFAGAVRGVSGHPWTRMGMVLHQLRFGALPLLVAVSAIVDLTLPLMPWIEQHLTGLAGLALGWIGINTLMLAMLVLVPPLLVRLWGGRPLPLGPVRDRLQHACDAMGVRVHQLMRWPVPGGKVYNAAVVGMVPRFRYVLFTDDLLRDLPERELMAVVGHELGHARHGHLWLFFLFANVVMAGSMLVDHLGFRIPGPPGIPEDLIQAAVALLAIAALWRVIFGFLSRACERQADLAGAELAGDAGAMEAALKSVARLSGQPENAPNWRHYTIAERVGFLQRVRADPPLARTHHRTLGAMRFSLILLLVVMIASLAMNHFFNPVRAAGTAADPAAELQRIADTDAVLQEALNRADVGDPTELGIWYSRASNLQRQTFLGLHFSMMGIAAKNGGPGAGEREGYRLRHRLRPLVWYRCGNPQWDLMLDNDLAAALVTGTDNPTAADRELAQQLLPRLEAAVATQSVWEYLDTIACVHFVLGNFQKSKDAFSTALSALGTDSKLSDAERAVYHALVTKRLDAAEANRLAAKEGRALLALPLEGAAAPAPPAEQPHPTTPPPRNDSDKATA